MLNIVRHLVGILTAWAQAMAGWRSNPLCRYWRLAEARRAAAHPWWQRTPGLAISGLVLAVAVTLGEVLVILDYHRLGQTITIASKLHVIHHASLATAIFAGGMLIFALIWLLSRVHTAVLLALGFLETDPRQVLRTVLDDLVATSHLTAQEILVGAMAYCLRLIAPPLALLSLAGLLAALPRLQWVVLDAQTYPGAGPTVEVVREALTATLGGVALLFLSGCLAAVILASLCIAVSLNRQSALAPPVGAASLVVMQLLLLAGALFIRARDISDYGMGEQIGIGNLVIFILLVCLLLYLARRLLWLRRALAYGFPLLILAPAEIMLSVIIFQGFEASAFAVIFNSFIWAMQSMAVIAPLNLLETIGGGEFINFTGTWFQVTLVLGQLVLMIATAEFARDAIRRRKWGAESERI